MKAIHVVVLAVLFFLAGVAQTQTTTPTPATVSVPIHGPPAPVSVAVERLVSKLQELYGGLKWWHRNPLIVQLIDNEARRAVELEPVEGQEGAGEAALQLFLAREEESLHIGWKPWGIQLAIVLFFGWPTLYSAVAFQTSLKDDDDEFNAIFYALMGTFVQFFIGDLFGLQDKRLYVVSWGILGVANLLTLNGFVFGMDCLIILVLKVAWRGLLLPMFQMYMRRWVLGRHLSFLAGILAFAPYCLYVFLLWKTIGEYGKHLADAYSFLATWCVSRFQAPSQASLLAQALAQPLAQSQTQPISQSLAESLARLQTLALAQRQAQSMAQLPPEQLAHLLVESISKLRAQLLAQLLALLPSDLIAQARIYLPSICKGQSLDQLSLGQLNNLLLTLPGQVQAQLLAGSPVNLQAQSQAESLTESLTKLQALLLAILQAQLLPKTLVRTRDILASELQDLSHGQLMPNKVANLISPILIQVQAQLLVQVQVQSIAQLPPDTQDKLPTLVQGQPIIPLLDKLPFPSRIALLAPLSSGLKARVQSQR